MKIAFAAHALDRMRERGISVDEVVAAVARGTKRTQGEKVIATYRYFEVVYRRRGEGVLVITVMERW